MADIGGNDTAFFMHEEQLMSGLGEKHGWTVCLNDDKKRQKKKMCLTKVLKCI